jgi:L-asparaginase II
VPESRHLGAAVLVDAEGRVVDSRGDASALFYPRSAAKSLQATAMLRLGADLDGPHLAIAQSSHTGTPQHLQLVDDVLQAARLGREHLGCPEAWPRRPAAIREVASAQRVMMACSGKHAGFLSTAVQVGADPSTYLELAHPVQQAVAATIADLSGEHVAHWGVDGCRAPTPVISLTGFARAVGRAVREHPQLIASAVTAPWAIDEPGGENAVVIAATGALAKTGAEGVLVIASPQGWVLVVKALDGAERVGTPVALELLARNGLHARETVDDILAAVGDPAVRVVA